jgi:hypothetical protein
MLYGSYLYDRTPYDATTQYATVDDLLDKRADFIIVVDDKETAQRILGEKLQWDQKTMDKQLRIQDASPLYYCLTTDTSVAVPLRDSEEETPVSYKVGIVGKESFLGTQSPYLLGRLSKPVNILASTPETVEKLDDLRDGFTELVLSQLPKAFTGETFLRAYSQLSYSFEVYRIFDVIKKKALKVLDADYFDLEKDEQVSMRNALFEQTKSVFEDAVLYTANTFPERTYLNPVHEEFPSGFLLKANLQCLGSSLQNARTNRATGSSNLAYVARKFKK